MLSYRLMSLITDLEKPRYLSCKSLFVIVKMLETFESLRKYSFWNPFLPWNLFSNNSKSEWVENYLYKLNQLMQSVSL